ncbi:type I-E CRISPR-associated protein Cse1/CasA [Micromonospora sp. NPDC049903]|uniref:type I-E CRISPR-associated protein Cse1/CasA n=1 Tax=Micromonospora sp. NPDC049903 TaxID=3364276 RepID=UPI00378E9ED8
MDNPSFNLTDDAWIPVVAQRDGPPTGQPDHGSFPPAPQVWSLADVLTRAHEIDALGLANPLEVAAVLRQVLVPAYIDACGVPRSEEEWRQRWMEGALPSAQIKGYLTSRRSLFDLFGPRPFGQVAGLRTRKDETKPVSLLVAAIATGNNVPMFTSRTEANPPPLSPAEAVRAMLAAQCWDTAAIKSGAADDPQAGAAGKTTGNPTGPCGALGIVVPLGRNLAETILLNTPIVRHPPTDDVPQWRREPRPTGVWETRGARGLLDLLTWQSRRVRLIPERTAGGDVVVRRAVLTAGDRLLRVPQDVEPHTAWRQVDKPKANQPSVMPVRHVLGREAWRGLESLLATIPSSGTKVFSSNLLVQLHQLRMNGHIPADAPVQVLTVGVAYGNQSAVVEDVIADVVPLPLTALDPDSDVRQVVETVVVQAEELRRAANRLGDDLRQAAGGEALPWDKGQRLGDGLMFEFSQLVRRLLAGLQRQPQRWEEAEDAWRQAAQELAFAAGERVLAATPPTAFFGHKSRDKKFDGKDTKPMLRASTAESSYRRTVRRILGSQP